MNQFQFPKFHINAYCSTNGINQSPNFKILSNWWACCYILRQRSYLPIWYTYKITSRRTIMIMDELWVLSIELLIVNLYFIYSWLTAHVKSEHCSEIIGCSWTSVEGELCKLLNTSDTSSICTHKHMQSWITVSHHYPHALSIVTWASVFVIPIYGVCW